MAEEASVIEQEGVDVATGTVVGDIGSKRSADDDDEDSVPPYKRFKIVSQEEQFKWSLPDGMATMRTNCSKIIFQTKR